MKPLILLLTFLSLSAMANPDQKIKDLGIDLAIKSKPAANYVLAVRTGNLLFLAGHIPVKPNGDIITGKLGKDLNTKQGAEAAKVAGVTILSTIKQELGSLSKVKRLVKVTGMVNAAPDFTQHSQVVNGFSDLMVAVFGEQGKHARAAVGMSSLPANAAVEIEVILEIKE